MKRFLGAVLAVTAVITLIDIVLHNVILLDAYKQTMALWRPEAEMKDLFWLIWAGYPVWAGAISCSNRRMGYPFRWREHVSPST